MRRTVSLRRAGKNINGDRWCVVWRTPVMHASSFFYFKTKREAIAFAKSVQP